MDFNRNVTRVALREIKKPFQLKVIDGKNVSSSGFVDEEEKHFEIHFETESGEKIDLVIMFERRYPEMFISDPYK